MEKKLMLVLLVFQTFCFLSYSQGVLQRKFKPDDPVFFTPKNHDPNFKIAKDGSYKSFYQSKSEWQHIIDTTWGPGDSLPRKLLIFNTYANAVHDYFAGFPSRPVNWDSLYTHYLNQINESTSKGAFAAIMGHFAYELRDLHTLVLDLEVYSTPRNPGVPLLFTGTYGTVEHFGAVTTVLSDSSTLVLRVTPNHPLGLQPGDIILGYEGIPWKKLVKELFEAGLPGLLLSAGCNSASTYFSLSGAGWNWHLFNNIDILKYSTGDTVHLSVLPLLDLDIPPMANNEQLPVKNIPLPNILSPPVSDTLITYGIIENSNIGYFYIVSEAESDADQQLYNAINALKNTDALIMDLRLNYGGFTIFKKAFSILFNEYYKTLSDLYRCNTNTFEMCSANNWTDYQIRGSGPGYYDRPIAVLLGPSCFSQGDMTAHQLRYHPMVRFFGASPPASFGTSRYELNIPGWSLYYCGLDMFHANDPSAFLNGKEFPLDYPVWFNKDDVADGKDPIVERSLEWINNLAYGHSVTTDKWLYSAVDDTVIINSTVENPNSHQVYTMLLIESLDSSVIDSTEMTRSVLGNGMQWQGKWKTPGPADNTYCISVKVTDSTNGTFYTNKHARRITTVPLLIDSLPFTAVSKTKYSFKPYFKNAGTSQTVSNNIVNLTCNDPWVTTSTPIKRILPNLTPGLIKGVSSPFSLSYDTNSFPGYFNLKFSVSTDGWPLWELDTTLSVPTGVQEAASMGFLLEQNFPNPFSSTTTMGL